MNGFSRKKVGTLTLGEKLKKLRSERRISLSEVSRFTHIQIKYLEYIESGEYEKLPADVYVKGFLKSYADFLGIDEKIFIKLFKKEKGIKSNIKKGKNISQKIFKPINIKFFSVTPKRIAAFFGFLSVLIIIFLLYSEVVSFTNNPKLIIFNLESKLETAESSTELQGVTEKDAKLFLNNQPVLVSDKGEFKEELSLQPGLNYVEIKAINRFEKETTKNFTIICKEPKKEEIQPEENNEDNQEQKLTLEVKVESGPVWLKVESDGSLVFNGNMLYGAVQKFEAKDSFKISSGMANATLVKFCQEDFKKLSSEEGSQKNIIFKKTN